MTTCSNRPSAIVLIVLGISALCLVWPSDGATTTTTVTNSPDLSQLCALKNGQTSNKFPVTRGSHLIALVKQLEREPDSSAQCSETARLALSDLNRLVNYDKDQICSPEKVQQIRSFSDKYIGEQQQQSNEELPAWLKSFFLAYGLQVSSICKKNMITSLLYESQGLIEQKDFDAIESWIDEKSLIASVMNEPGDYDDLILPRDITRAFGAAPNEKLVMQTATGNLIARIQLVCQRRFKPIYEQLILPLVSLSNLGFNYQGEDLKIELKEMSINREVHQWYRITYLCESLSSIDIVDDPAFNQESGEEANDKRVVRILNKEEVAKLRQERPAESSSPLSEQDLRQFKQLEFKPDYTVSLPSDEILDSSDRNLVKLINKFSSHKSEIDRIRDKLYKKIGNFMLQNLKKGNFKVIGSIVLGQKDKNDAGSAQDELVRALDGLVNDRKLASAGDTAVAGFGKNTVGVAKRYINNAQYQGVSGMTANAARQVRDGLSAKRKFWYTIATIFMVGAILVLANAMAVG